MNVIQEIVKNAKTNPNALALVTSAYQVTYQELLAQSTRFASCFLSTGLENSVCCILSKKSEKSYIAFLSCLLSGLTYFPINITSGFEKNKKIIESVNPAIIYLGDIDEKTALSFLKITNSAHVFTENKEIFSKIIDKTHHHLHLIEAKKEFVATDFQNISHKNAYLFFTSGSTGDPKGVLITVDNMNAYFESIMPCLKFKKHERFLQLNDLGFDLSIHEIVTCWLSCGALYVYDDSKEWMLSSFINKNNIHHCVFVPSALSALLSQLNQFALPVSSIKKIIACGEPFPVLLAKQFSAISSKTEMINLYGPTEATIACTMHRYNPNEDYGLLSILPIGFPLSSASVFLSEKNELIIRGPQVSPGYWKKPSNAFFCQDDSSCYQTGDIAAYDPKWGYLFQGRKDDQWQVNGYRIEKNEIESVLKKVIGVQSLSVVPFFKNELIDFLVLFSDVFIEYARYKKLLLRYFPAAIIPKYFFHLDSIPKLDNGKINYRLLKEKMQEFLPC